MTNTLIIGAGGAGNVTAQKCSAWPEVFGHVHLASRRIEKCEEIRDRCKNAVSVYQIDADYPKEVFDCIQKSKADIVINLALPYQDLSIMDACLEARVPYVDTANYEPRNEAKFCYRWQWDYHEKFKEKGIIGLLGCGFDPGVTNAFCAHAKKNHFDEIHSIDIIDCNDGDHGHPFATNFNPEINIREITAKGKYYDNGNWIEIAPMSKNKMIHYPEIGERKSYLLYHEELESLVKNIPEIKQARFWMTFSDPFLTHLQVLQNIGMTSIAPIPFQGKDIIPIEFLKALLPEPASLAAQYKGKTCIGCKIEGQKDGATKTILVYNNCDHEETFKEVHAQAISYTTGVPAMIGAALVLTKKWAGSGVFNVEELDPDPFMDLLNRHGLRWKEETL
jgi:saccharopine dehydrogenase (NAD+, L-lysine-forming)